MGKKNHTWEQLSQVEKIMEENKPVKVREQPRPIGWEKCVHEYLEKDKERWDRMKR